MLLLTLCAIIVESMPQKFNPRNIKLIVGLGNEGSEYENTYHNVGWQALDYLAGSTHFKKMGSKPFRFAKISALPPLIKPLPFMNVSGHGTAAAYEMDWGIKNIDDDAPQQKKSPRNVIVIHDDSDIPIGEYKIQFGGGSAGHKGIISHIQKLGSESFWRIRIGIRKMPHAETVRPQRLKAGDFVLSPITNEDALILRSVFEHVAHDLELREHQ